MRSRLAHHLAVNSPPMKSLPWPDRRTAARTALAIVPATPGANGSGPGISAAHRRDVEGHVIGSDIAWMLISTALVLLMTPALGFFYAGLVRSKNALNTLMMSVVSLGFVGLAWALAGYSLAFAEGTRFLGGLDYALLRGVGFDAKGTIPHLLFMAFQGTFAIITAALISGAIVERMRFATYIAFITAWSLIVYAPVAHWVWGGGWLGQMGALDFAGGTVVHITAGTAACVAAIMLGPRKDYARQAFVPHSVPLTLLGAGVLWFGWFGFNGGSAVAANNQAVLAFVNTMFAPAATLAVWTLIDVARTGKATAVGVATAIVVGLVAITPAAGFVSPLSAIILGGVAAIPSYLGVLWRARTRLDDSLDVVAAHGVGGTVGALLTGVLAQKAWGSPADGLLFGNPAQLGVQALAVVVAIAFTAVMTAGILFLARALAPVRAAANDEGVGLDVTQHGEEAYGREEGAILILPGARTSETVAHPAFEPTLKHAGR
jgi:Amt family ammonium transporter